MTRWIRRLFRRSPAAPIVRSNRTCLGLQRLEERDTPATFTVTNLLDDGSTGSLRWAVGQANSTNGADTVAFQAGLTGKIILGAPGQLSLSDTTGETTITGPGANLLTIGANYTWRLVSVQSGVTATITGLTLTEGTSQGNTGGGAVFNSGTLTLQRMVFQNNQSTVGNGGAIANGGTLNIDQSLFVGNTAYGMNGADGSSTGFGGGGGGGAAFGGAIYSVSALTITNSTFTSNVAGGGFGGKGLVNSGLNGVGGAGGSNGVYMGGNGRWCGWR